MNLLGYCTRMMVFEYAPCGSLFEHLHSDEDNGLLVLWASSIYLDGKRPLNGMADPMLREERAAMGEVARLMRGVTALSPEQATPLWSAELEIASAA
uniref:Protein kinase domain-containing protein n=1 Tax=Setaria viridis TaxID=4556 RepID=A0A4U6U1M5_SETVI|nr:hypothetical protein SEVIR_7G340428v2 [Setaria viridis]